MAEKVGKLNMQRWRDELLILPCLGSDTLNNTVAPWELKSAWWSLLGEYASGFLERTWELRRCSQVGGWYQHRPLGSIRVLKPGIPGFSLCQLWAAGGVGEVQHPTEPCLFQVPQSLRNCTKYRKERKHRWVLLLFTIGFSTQKNLSAKDRRKKWTNLMKT